MLWCDYLSVSLYACIARRRLVGNSKKTVYEERGSVGEGSVPGSSVDRGCDGLNGGTLLSGLVSG